MMPVEIIVRPSSFHDYYTKHAPDVSEVIIPATLKGSEKDDVLAAGLLAHQCIGARGISKTDMILGHDGCLYFLEINTIPSFIPTGALAMAAAGYGLSLPEVCERIIEATYDPFRTN